MRLIRSIIELPEVLSIGKTGSKNISSSQENDVDIFIICDNVPDLKLREKLYNDLNYDLKIKTNNIEDKYWGTMDFINMDKLEIYLMYFQKSKVENEIENGKSFLKKLPLISNRPPVSTQNLTPIASAF